MRAMGTKSVLSLGAALAIANQAGYQGHCEINPRLCLHNAPDQLHSELHAAALPGSSLPNTLNAEPGVFNLIGADAGLATGSGKTGTANILEGADVLVGSGHVTPLSAEMAARPSFAATLT
jgi:hypothetical protein